MPKLTPEVSGLPQHTLLANFWRSVLDDLHGRGVPTDKVPRQYRGLPYHDRVTVERDILAKSAETFIESSDFTTWCQLSGLDPDYMRGALYDDAL